MIFKIESWLTGKVLFEADCESLKLCIELAVSQDANLQDANLQDANLQDANLQYANLQYAKLQDANLQDAKLQDANLQYANLQYANLQYANLQGANLQGANLQGAALIQVTGLEYTVILTPTHADVGCKHHTFEEWRNFTKEEINRMDGKKALKFYPDLIRIIDFFRPTDDEDKS